MLISSILLTQCNNFIHDLIPREGLSTPDVPPSYTVTFDKNNGDSGSTEANPPTAVVADGGTVNPLPKQPARIGYTFSGWNTAANGGGTAFTASTPVTANITVYAQWNPLHQYFAFTVRPGAGGAFAIPTSGLLDGSLGNYYIKPYNWNIVWGDGCPPEHASGNSGFTSAGISHTYSSAGSNTTYTITITPNGSADAWLGAFGFADNNYFSGANAQANRAKVISVDSPLTVFMTRTQAEINAGTPPSNEWAWTFNTCYNLKMGPGFKFADEWDLITTVDDDFAYSMFVSCIGTDFTMNNDFNLPQGITTVGDNFAYCMFQDCTGATFNMNSVFNLPQGIKTVGDWFAAGMFGSMYNSVGSNFKVNSVFKFPVLDQAELDKTGVYEQTFYSSDTRGGQYYR